MRDYWFTQEILRAIGIGYLLAVVLGVGLAVWLGRGWKWKATAVAIVLGLAGVPVINAIEEAKELQRQNSARHVKKLEAKKIFDERCKATGDKVNRTIENVASVYLIGKPVYSTGETEMDVNPFMEHFGDDYIKSFLLHEVSSKSPERRLAYDNKETSLPGYSNVVTVDEKDRKIYRYSLSNNNGLIKEEVLGELPRYAVEIKFPIEKYERQNWIASRSIRIVDKQTQEVLGESLSYLFDPELGSRSGQRTPWAFAVGCGNSKRYSPTSVRFFSSQVLKPKN